jgi:hypothetical protein
MGPVSSRDGTVYSTRDTFLKAKGWEREVAMRRVENKEALNIHVLVKALFG